MANGMTMDGCLQNNKLPVCQAGKNFWGPLRGALRPAGSPLQEADDFHKRVCYNQPRECLACRLGRRFCLRHRCPPDTRFSAVASVGASASQRSPLETRTPCVDVRQLSLCENKSVFTVHVPNNKYVLTFIPFYIII